MNDKARIMNDKAWALVLAFVGGVLARIGQALCERFVLPRLGLA